MPNQPQPAWEARLQNLWWKEIPTATRELEHTATIDFIRSLLATERLKWQEEMREELSHLELLGSTHIVKGYNKAIFDVLKRFPVTPPPQEETR